MVLRGCCGVPVLPWPLHGWWKDGAGAGLHLHQNLGRSGMHQAEETHALCRRFGLQGFGNVT